MNTTKHSTLLGVLRSPATCKNAGAHGGEGEIRGKDGVGAPSRQRGSPHPMTSANAGHLRIRGRFGWTENTSLVGSALITGRPSVMVDGSDQGRCRTSRSFSIWVAWPTAVQERIPGREEGVVWAGRYRGSGSKVHSAVRVLASPSLVCRLLMRGGVKGGGSTRLGGV